MTTGTQRTFLTWEGWAAVSAIAQILALATLVVAVWRFVILRRQMPLFQLTWDFIGEATRGPDAFHVVEFRNIGRGSGHLMMLTLVHARPELAVGYMAPGMLSSGESFQLLVSSSTIEQAWVRYMFRTTDDAQRFSVVWRPLAPSGTRADQWSREVDEWRARSYYERLRDKIRPRVVEPGGAPRGSARGKVEKFMAFFESTGDERIFFPAQAGQHELPNLPYVPPAA